MLAILGLTFATSYMLTACDDDDDDTVTETTSGSSASGTIGSYGYVDLGLPSELKWALYNVGADSPVGFGDYFAWGEIESADEFTSDNSSTYGVEMPDISGDSSYDAASAIWGSTWRMPTQEEFDELLDECSWSYTTKSGVVGYLVTGSNGNAIFLPAAGHYDGSTLMHSGTCGTYWSSTPNSSNNSIAYYLDFNSSHNYVYSDYRYYGGTIRAVSE